MNWPRFRKNGQNGPQSNGGLIHMKEVRKVYDTGKIKVEALKGVDLTIKQGEFVAIVGPSGSGKSTLMNLLGCLDTISSGEYNLDGDLVTDANPDRLADIRNRKVGFVFQNFNLLPALTAYENVEMPMMFGGVASRERKQRAEDLLGRVGLGERMEHKPTELSGGQMQRVAIARALAIEPSIILADEPTGNLDTTSGSDIMTLFKELWDQGRTIVVVTHDMALANRAGRVIEIRDGVITRDTVNAA
ncbi:MAG: ABC transporter ATP-binding protein [Acidobacteriota bacterium]